jgi:hypothetical protein
VLFGHGSTGSKRPQSILVDFHNGRAGHDPVASRGGKFKSRRIWDDSAGEVLIMNPDGKLILREAARDATDPERLARLARVRQRAASVKNKD